MSSLKIEEKIIGHLPTSGVDLNPKEYELDYLVETESNHLINLEFQSTKPTKEDFSRFLRYAAFTHYRYQKQIDTYIICTANVKNIDEKYWFSHFCYFRGKIINLSNINGDEILNKIEDKNILNKEDQSNLSLIPLYSTNNTLIDQFKKAVNILIKSENDKKEKQDIADILSILADKFLNEKEKEELQEKLKMRFDIFHEIREEGIEEGIELTIRQLIEKKNIPIKDISEATGLTIEEINKILN